MEVQPAQVKTRGGHPSDPCPLVDRDLPCTYAVPDWRNTERYWPVPRILPDRGIPVVHELVAVVLELLAKIVQHRPGLMTGRAAQTVLPGKRWKGVRALAAAQD